MLSENPYVQIYTKRVLRRVPLDEDLEYIAGEIQRDIAAKVAAEQKVHPELTVQQIVKRLDDPAATARRYRQIYNLSTRAVQMFDLPLIYASVAALYMVTAFFVFRVFPQRDPGNCGKADRSCDLK